MSYLEINSVEQPSPIELETKMARVQIVQRAYGGMKRRNMAVTAGETHNAMSISVMWDGINATELAIIETAWTYCYENVGVLFKADDLTVPTTGGLYTDEVYVTVFPDTGFAKEFIQEWDAAGNGPILYKVDCVFLAQPIVYS